MDYYGPLHIHSRLPHQQKRYSYDHTTSYPAPYTPSYFDIAHLPLMPLQQGIYKRQFYAHQQQQTHQLLGTYQPQPLHPWPWLAKCRAPTAAATTTFDMDWSAENGGGDAATRGEASTISGVDELMRVIQDKSLKPSSGTSSSDSGEAAGTSTDGGRSKTVGDTGSGAGASIDASTRAGNSKKQYECHIGECRKAFLQFSHLEIHTRVHTGEKPYHCTYPTCTSAFSQLGNLRTHYRRHIGERPFACHVCGKSFSQKGSLRAHTSVHNTGEAPKRYACRLDGCEKPFTQLGNLKTHMNKFHQETLGVMKERLGGTGKEKCENEGEKRELLKYFRGLYRNANKGIKGRGRGRKVASFPSSSSGAFKSSAFSAGLPPLSASTLPSSSLPCSTSKMNTNLSLGLGTGSGMGINGVGIGGMWMEMGTRVQMDMRMGTEIDFATAEALKHSNQDIFEWNTNSAEGQIRTPSYLSSLDEEELAFGIRKMY